ncbi:MAG: PadR family transcriptional regulator [Faecalibacillus faecis]
MPKREMEVLTPQMYYVLLVLHQPMHGYEIMNEITRITNGEITVGAGSLYTLLPKFEKECYIKLVKVENNKNLSNYKSRKKKLQKEKKGCLNKFHYWDQIGG